MHTHTQQLPGVALGEISGQDAHGAPLVRIDGVEVVALVACGPRDWSRMRGASAVLAFVDGDRTRPVVLGVVDPAAAPAVQAEPRTLRIAAGEELRIECGKASIHLRADGRIEIRGEHLVSRSRGPNKIKGGTVHLN